MTSDISKLKEFYNSRWKNFDFINHLKLERCIAILEGVKQTGLTAPKICDLGCGAGWLAGVLGVIGPTVGVDLSSEAISCARAKYPYVDFYDSDILNWNYDGEKFDIVVSQEVIEHIENQDRYLDVVFKLLKPGGCLILTTPNKKVFDWFSREKQIKWSNQPVEKWLCKRDLKELLKRRFEIHELTTIIPGYEEKPVLKWLNSYRLRAILEKLKLYRMFNEIRLKSGLGLHLFLMARKSGVNQQLG